MALTLALLGATLCAACEAIEDFHPFYVVVPDLGPVPCTKPDGDHQITDIRTSTDNPGSLYCPPSKADDLKFQNGAVLGRTTLYTDYDCTIGVEEKSPGCPSSDCLDLKYTIHASGDGTMLMGTMILTASGTSGGNCQAGYTF